MRFNFPHIVLRDLTGSCASEPVEDACEEGMESEAVVVGEFVCPKPSTRVGVGWTAVFISREAHGDL